MIMRERFQLCERRLREKGFERASRACQVLWYEKHDFDFRGKNSTWSIWSKKELEILQNTMKELAGNRRPQNGCYRICQKRLEGYGFKRSPQACKQRYQKDKAGKDGAEEEYVWTGNQIHLLGKAFQTTLGAYGQLNSDQRFKRISEMLNKTGGMTVPVTGETCMEQWYRMPAEERCKIEKMIPISRGAISAVCRGPQSMSLPVESSSLTEGHSTEHTEQASYLLEHLTSDYDCGPSQELQKQKSSHINQSALCTAESEEDEIFAAPVSACQGTAKSAPSTETSSKPPIIKVTEIVPQNQIIEQAPNTGRTTQVSSKEAMDEQSISENLGNLTNATTESIAEQYELDKSPSITQDEPFKPSNLIFQDPFPAQGHDTGQMTLEESSAMSGDRPSGGEEEPSQSISAADLSAAVADEITERCEETTTGWGHLDIGFCIADCN